MRVFVAGGTGVVGRGLIPMLTAAGHQVTATTRSPGKTAQLRKLGAEPVVAGWPNQPVGGPVKTEDDPFDPHPPASMTESLRAIQHLEQAVPAGVPEGLVLRYGILYGPGASDDLAGLVRKGRLPVVGGGTGIWSFTHVTDAASAAAAAVLRGAPGLYNAVDDEPAKNKAA
jgi:nucleoside-diphosphate-sugar epimerase